MTNASLLSKMFEISYGALFRNLGFQAGTRVSGFVAAGFQRPNFKGALIEFCFDLSAPFGYRFQFFL